MFAIFTDTTFFVFREIDRSSTDRQIDMCRFRDLSVRKRFSVTFGQGFLLSMRNGSKAGRSMTLNDVPVLNEFH